MSKLKLKAAMESLQVNKPLKLQTRQPQFKVPSTIPTDALVADEATVHEETQVRNQTMVGKPTSVENHTTVQNPTRDGNRTQVKKQTQVGNKTLVGKPSQVHHDQHSSEVDGWMLMRRATEQDSSVVLEARAVDGLERGYTRLPNTILMRLVSGDFTRNEIKIALLIARFTISFQRKQSPLSKAVLARRSNLRDAAVLEAIAGLVYKGLVEKQQGDQNRPNMLGLVLPPDWDMLIKPPLNAEATQVENLAPVENQTQVRNPTEDRNSTRVEKPTQVGNQTPVENLAPASVEKPTPAGVRNSTYFKDKEKYLNKNSLSVNLSSEILQKYFSELKPARKQESEEMAFKGLRRDFTESAIERAFEYLLKHGTPGDKKPCHSPMAYLAMAMVEVSQTLKNQQEQEKKTKRTQEIIRNEIENQAKEKAQEEKEINHREQVFLQNFPTTAEQQEIIAKFATRFPMLDPKGTVVRSLAISTWWEEIEFSPFKKNKTL